MLRLGSGLPVPGRSVGSSLFVLVMGMGTVAVDSMVGVRRGERIFERGREKGETREIGEKAEMPESVSSFVSLCPSHPLPLADSVVVGEVAGHRVTPGGLSHRPEVKFSLCFLVEVLEFAKVT